MTPMVMRPPGASPGADSQRLCAWILDAALAALPPGQECVLGIFDLKGFSLQNADLGFARFLVRGGPPSFLGV